MTEPSEYTIRYCYWLLNEHEHIRATRDDVIGVLRSVRERMGHYPTEDMMECAISRGRPGYRFDWRDYFVDRLCAYDYSSVMDVQPERVLA